MNDLFGNEVKPPKVYKRDSIGRFADEEIEVEIYADVDGRDVSLSLVSAGANEAIEEYKNKVIDEQIEQ